MFRSRFQAYKSHTESSSRGLQGLVPLFPQTAALCTYRVIVPYSSILGSHAGILDSRPGEANVLALSPSDPEGKESAKTDGATEKLEGEWDEGPVRYSGYAARAARVLAIAGKSAKAASRYIAYSSDVGEAARPLVSPMFVKSMYGVAFAYVGVDVYLHAKEASEKSNGDTTITARAGIETLVFQSLASLIVPSLIIHTAVHKCQGAVKNASNVMVKRYAPTVLGLAIIPLLPFTIDEPIEHAVEWGFEEYWPIDKEGKPSPSSETRKDK
jgi:mitochondrial fission process protein 1|eukprot:g4120.t1